MWRMTLFTLFFSLFWLQILNLPASLQNKNTRIGPFPWKQSVLQNPDRERTNQSTGICLGLGLPYNKYMLPTFHKQQLVFLPFQLTICSETLVWRAVLVSSTQVCEIYPNWHTMKRFCYFRIQKPNKCDKTYSMERSDLEWTSLTRHLTPIQTPEFRGFTSFSLLHIVNHWSVLIFSKETEVLHMLGIETHENLMWLLKKIDNGEIATCKRLQSNQFEFRTI